MSILSLTDCIHQIEAELARIYRFSIYNSAADHLISTNDLNSLSIKETTANEIERAGVLLCENNDGYLDIGIHICDDLIARINQVDPRVELNEYNLDAYCTIVEEISHFHLILNRAREGRQVSFLELEWQGEVDKLLLSAIRLAEQHEDPHLLPLYFKIFTHHKILSRSSAARYKEASKYAARFWERLIQQYETRRSPLEDTYLHSELQRAYRVPAHEKFPSAVEMRAA